MVIAVIAVWAVAVLLGIILLILLIKRKRTGSGKIYMRHGVRLSDKESRNHYEDIMGVLGNDEFDTLVTGEKSPGEHPQRAGYLLQLRSMSDNSIISGGFWNQIVLGRKKMENYQGCFLTINDRLISRNHCKIFCNSSGCYIEDLESKNHTTLNGVQINSCVPLRSGSILEIGREKYQITLTRRG